MSLAARRPDDRYLAERIRSGDGTALGELYDRYAAAAMATATRFVADTERAQDLVHDAFVSAWRTIDRFDASQTGLGAWLMAIVRTVVDDVVTPDPEPASPAPGSGHSVDPTADPRARELRAALGALPADQRRALELACFEGRSYGEIATLTGATEGAVLARLRAAVVTVGSVARATAVGSAGGVGEHTAIDKGPFRILVIDDNSDVCEVVTAILGDEGYEVITLGHVTDDAVSAAIGRVEPDCILLDGAHAVEYAEGWVTATDIRRRPRPIPTVMFTSHLLDAAEAVDATSERAVAAGFAAVLRKPFELDELVATVDRAVGGAVRFNDSEAAQRERTRALVGRLTAAGARDVRASAKREWVNFHSGAGDEMQLYWWQSAGAYLVSRYAPDGGRLELVGRYYAIDAAVRAAMDPKPVQAQV